MAISATLIAATATIKRVSLKVAAARGTTGVRECTGTTRSRADGGRFKTIGEDFFSDYLPEYCADTRNQENDSKEILSHVLLQASEPVSIAVK